MREQTLRAAEHARKAIDTQKEILAQARRALRQHDMATANEAITAATDLLLTIFQDVSTVERLMLEVTLDGNAEQEDASSLDVDDLYRNELPTTKTN